MREGLGGGGDLVCYIFNILHAKLTSNQYDSSMHMSNRALRGAHQTNAS